MIEKIHEIFELLSEDTGTFTGVYPALHSAEIRWFKNGAIPKSIGKEFGGFEDRSDYYWVQPLHGPGGLNNIGIKWREGHLEAKVRQTTKNHESDVLPGRTETWIKYNLGRSEMPAGTYSPEPGWLEIRKSRSLIKYRYSPQDGALRRTTGFIHDDGCNVELTKTTAQDRNYWSFGLEAYSSGHDLMEPILLTTLNKILNEFQIPVGVFDPGQSQGYPQWIEGIFL